ncbi:MAG: hypothetical protein APG12_01335 [Candidatus Methanofastidiosum methylothiophilum]|uniref:Archaeal Type IV pilin N-terminal domain-containing protein n=1 Tax=Candidatus Methanofastidiosum methylothiophilum TaxID=1705564 RepID=A0A150IP59_9EURY|nr:MAG: hypothetical protein APG11_01713 [Candidatus Methanofastidiosum methylthiophilus]KYC49623.1 MAG: hypothetical protein APG12_01335 [Candidatus Methanofastidiosum methylthiophilus]
MMKFFRKHRKAVSPVIAVMLLVAVAVAAVGAYFIWFRSFQTQTQKSVQESSSGALGGSLQMVSMTDDGRAYYVVIKNTSGSTITLNAVVANPGSDLNNTAGTATIANGSIAAQATQTFTLTPYNWASGGIIRGTTRTFTFKATDAATPPAEVILIHTYTDS